MDPVVAASAQGSFVPFQVATIALSGAVLLTAWALIRKRSARLAWIPLALLLFILVGTFVPSEATDAHGIMQGTLTGSARIPLASDPDAPLQVTGGIGQVLGQNLTLDCPQGCNFSVGMAAFGVSRSAAPDVNPGGTLVVDLMHGPLQVTSQTVYCQRVPLMLELTAGGPTCYVCDSATYATEATDARGAKTLAAPPFTTCAD